VRYDWRRSVVQIEGPGGAVRGAGFLIDRGVVVTCYHVVDRASPRLFVRFWRESAWLMSQPLPAVVVPEQCRAREDGDVAVLRLEATAPAEASPLPLGRPALPREVVTMGFRLGPERGEVLGGGLAGSLVDVAGEAGNPGRRLIQVNDAPEVTRGFSGAPLVDPVTGRVMGMVVDVERPDQLMRGARTCYAVPVEFLTRVRPSLVMADDLNPYKGLEAFTSADERFFRGRAEVLEGMVDSLRRDPRLLLVLGPSGSGKSSLVQAGLLPALARAQIPRSDSWTVLSVVPGNAPLVALESAGLPGATEDLSGAVSEWLRHNNCHERLVLVIDQGEELFTHQQVVGPERFLRQLLDVIDRNERLTVALVLRDDFYAQFAACAPALLQRARRTLVDIPARLDRRHLLEMIVGPAEEAGLALEEGLAEAIVAQVTGGEEDVPTSVLPSLQLTLAELWENRRDGRLTHAELSSLGGVAGVLAKVCDRAYEKLPNSLRPVARNVLTELVNPAAAGSLPTRRRQLVGDLVKDCGVTDDAVREVYFVVDHLSKARLITTSRSAVETGGSHGPVEGPVAELAHEALIREWPRLARWLEEDNGRRLWVSQVAVAAEKWRKTRDPGQLLSGGRLEEARRYARGRRLPERLTRLLDASNRAERRRIRRRRTVRGTIYGLLVVSLAASILAGSQTIAKAGEAERATADRLATDTGVAIQGKPDLAQLLAAESLRHAPTGRAITAAVNALAAPLNVGRTVTGAPAAVDAIAFSPDGTTLASLGADHAVRLWNRHDWQPDGAPLEGGTSASTRLSYSSDGNLLAAGGADHTILVWDTRTRRLRGRFPLEPQGTVKAVAFQPGTHRLAALASGDRPEAGGCVYRIDLDVQERDAGCSYVIDTVQAPMQSLAYSADGRVLAAADGRTIKAWVDGKQLPRFVTPDADERDLNGVAVSPDGQFLVAASEDRGVYVWSVDSPLATSLDGHEDAVQDVAFTPDGRTLASSSRDHTVRLWSLGETALGSQGRALGGLSAPAGGLAVSPDGASVAAAGQDGTIRVWTLATETGSLSAATKPVKAAAMAPDGYTLLAAGDDGFIRSWDTRTRTLNWGKSAGVGGASVTALALSPDGNTVAGAGSDGTIQFRDWRTGQALGATLRASSGYLTTIAYSRTGALLVSGGTDGAIQLWNPVSRTKLGHTLVAPEGSAVDNVVFDSRGEVLASTHHDGSVHRWDVRSGQPIGAPMRVPTGALWGIALSPDDAVLATAGQDGAIRLWDLKRQTPIGRPMYGHAGAADGVSFSPDGALLASTSADGTVRLWDVATRQPVGGPLIGHSGWVDAVVFSPGGTLLATTGAGSGDFTIRLWDLDPGHWVEKLCRRAGRNLSMTEWQRYVQPGTERVTYERTCPGYPAGLGAPADAPVAQYPELPGAL
jgi:WD40 repeat protein